METVKKLVTSEEARQAGNEKYKAGQYSQAITLYSRASELDPTDPAPQSNLAAAYFESGDYVSAITSCNKALDNLNRSVAQASLKQKLLLRKTKACTHSCRFSEAKIALDELQDSKAKTTLLRCIDGFELNRAIESDPKEVRRKFTDLPRYKPAMLLDERYCFSGHDFLQNVLEKSFIEKTTEKQPAILARNLVVILLLDDLSKAGEVEDMARTKTILALFYTFLAPIMPRFCSQELKRQIVVAIVALKSRRSLPAYVDIPEQRRQPIIDVLEGWKARALEVCPTNKTRRAAKASERRIQIDPLGVPTGMEGEAAFYKDTGVLLIPEIGNHLTHALPNAAHSTLPLEFNPNMPMQPMSTFLDAVDKTWDTNVTMVDLQAPEAFDPTEMLTPFTFGKMVQWSQARCSDVKYLEGVLSMWFMSIAKGLKDLSKHIKIEFRLGDVFTFMEKIQHGVLDDRQMDYPNRYHRIHLSNVPDYTGSSLATFVHALPLLQHSSTSYVTSCSLSGAGFCLSAVDSYNEHLALSSTKDIRDALKVYAEATPPKVQAYMYPMSEYNKWFRDDKRSELMSRPALETWLYRLFFKLYIPKEARNGTHLSPLNLTMFIRMCAHSQDNGYPPHWIGAILDNILSGTITTKARPPRSQPLKISETNSAMPPLEQSTAPFVAELSTLVSMTQVGLSLSSLAPNLPQLNSIKKFKLEIYKEYGGDPTKPHFMLLLVARRILPLESSLRQALLSDETYHGSKPKADRSRGIHVISTREWDQRSHTASFWLREDVMKQL